MNLMKTIVRVNLKSFWRLFKLGIKNPLFIYPTIIATKQCISISTQHFGRLHFKNTAANAFRHAFWNYLIAKKCTKWSKNIKTSASWAKNVTDWHENAFKNREMPRKMDLHNNEVGRAIFLKNNEISVKEVIDLLLELTKKSIKINEQSILKTHQFSLVHLTE